MDDKELDKLFGIDPEEDKAGSKEQNAPAADDAVQKSEEESGDKKEEPAKEEELKPEEGAAEEPEAEIEEEEESKAEPDAAKDVKEHDKKPIKKAVVRREEPFVKPAEDVSFRDMIPFSNATIAAFILGLAFIAMVLCILFLPAFRVKTVNIEGNVVLSDEEILSMTGLSYGDHILSGVSGNIFDLLSLNYGKTEQAIMEKNPYVESITISVKIPSTINIEIKERQKIAYIKTADGYLAIDRDGIVLELSSADNASEVRPVICGMEIDSAVLGEKLTIKNMNAFKKAIIVMGAILNADNASVGGDYCMFANTSEVRILPSGYIFLTIYSRSGNMVQIKLNNLDSIDEDMAWLLYLFNANAFDQVTSSGSFDMTRDEYIYQEYK
ncbi:MAG: FtsQ-type POTRA domain-containing protein [Clostridiales bacterium]|nr:FtsQ-type POTRA domain-containing protein [Clostridiales bacterium]MBQ5423117.1 FtsQ-type POTRA domain-containing protein [Clostridiales bacterium]